MTKPPLNKFMSVVLVICAMSILYSIRWIYATPFSLQIQRNMTMERGISTSGSDSKYTLLELLIGHIGKEQKSVSTEQKVEHNNSSQIKIGILIPSSTRNIQKPVLKKLSLVSISVPSLYNTFEKQYLYKIYIGIDKGDRLENFNDEIKSMFDCVVMVSVVGTNFVKSVNTIAEKAYKDGMDYLVRINDDTKFVTANWTSLAIERLGKYVPKNIGVVGPTCNYGNTAILTHDMVHRIHLEIFGFYYPPYFENWWADDWITRVYEPDRSSKLQTWTVKHLDGTVRYDVDFERKSWVNSIIKYDRKRLNKYLENPPTYKVM